MSSAKKKSLKVGKVSRKSAIGSAGPTAAWLKMSVAQRERTKQYIKEGFNGYTRDDGVNVPGIRRIYSGFDAATGFDLRHIERWPAARIAKARNRIQSLNTLTGRPFDVITPRTAKQKKAARDFTGQTLKDQKAMIVQVQLQGKDKAVFKNGKVGIERQFPSGSKTIKQRYLFKDYLKPSESLRDAIDEEEIDDEEITDDILDAPSTFSDMLDITRRMLVDMPKNVYGQPAYYTLLTVQYGPIGGSATHGKVLDLLRKYMNQYDPGSQLFKGHEKFVEQVIGFNMIGTKLQYAQYELAQRERERKRKERRKLRFTAKKKETRCTQLSAKTGRRCERKINHKGKHKFLKY